MNEKQTRSSAPSSGAWLELSHGSEGGQPSDRERQLADLRAMARGTLRGALHAHLHADAPNLEARVALRRLCDAAYARGLHAEELLVLLKDEWRGLHASRIAAREHAGATVAGVITLCIEEYYAPRRR